ncbi:MAG: hypothetical protein RIB60_09100 [Phycisphaerales bacterium]
MSKTIRTLATACLLTFLAGCGGITVRGTVVGSPIGRAVVVDARDERLMQPGIPGVELKIVRPGTETSGGIAPLATAVTDEAGRFSMRLSDRDKVRGALVIMAEGESALRSATRIYPPRKGQEVLVNVRERRTTGADGSTE